MYPDPLSAIDTVTLGGAPLRVARLDALAPQGLGSIGRLPYSIRILLENVARWAGVGPAIPAHVSAVLDWEPQAEVRGEIPFMPSRVLLQDFTGVPCFVDLAAMRSAIARIDGDAGVVNPRVPVDLVIDHSVQVDYYGSSGAYAKNVALEMGRNRERYALLRWAQQAFANVRVVPTGMGICHQVNLEYLAAVVHAQEARAGEADPGAAAGERWAFPDTVVGTDSHTTMINGLGVLGWGVGGIEAEAVMLGQPYFMLLPDVVGVRLTGRRRPDATATSIVLAVTKLLRSVGVVGRFVEYFGPGLAGLSVADRATIANMAPEYGATCGFFPVDEQTLRYLSLTARSSAHVNRVAEYCRLQGLFREEGSPDPEYSRVVELDIGEVRPALAGPRRPQDLVPVTELKQSFLAALPAMAGATGRADTTVCSTEVCLIGERAEDLGRFEGEGGPPAVLASTDVQAGPGGSPEADDLSPAERAAAAGRSAAEILENTYTLSDGAVVIAAITSCTNTSNPSVLLGAGLLARNAVARGLETAPWVKTSLAPGSRAVTGYLERAGLLEPLEALGFDVVGYGCTTCIGNSGPLSGPIAQGIKEEQLITVAVLSGNRNFEARIHPLVRANYLASPLLVLAYALAGRVDIDLTSEALGMDPEGRPVYLRDLWPTPEEIDAAVADSLDADLFHETYAHATEGDAAWRRLQVPEGGLYVWEKRSTYVQEPPFFAGLTATPAAPSDIEGARILGVFGDSVTTDHISPAGAIPVDSPAGRYLVERGVSPADFNTYGARRGNHEVLLRGTFANVRIRNLMLEGKEGGWALHQPSGELLTFYDAAMRYRSEGVPQVVLAGKEYGSGSSRDWAAKGPALMGVRAVIAEGFERIHRSNLVGMGVLPLQFEAGTTVATLGLTGREILDIVGIGDGEPREHGTGNGGSSGGKGGRAYSSVKPGDVVEVRVWRHRRDPGEEPDLRFPVRVRLDSKEDLEYYRHGGILPRVLRAMMAQAGP